MKNNENIKNFPNKTIKRLNLTNYTQRSPTRSCI